MLAVRRPRKPLRRSRPFRDALPLCDLEREAERGEIERRGERDLRRDFDEAGVGERDSERPREGEGDLDGMTVRR